MNISEKTITELKKEFIVDFDDESYYPEIKHTPKSAVSISLSTFNPFFKYWNFKTPKTKEVTYNWIMDKINSDKVYKNFATTFNKLINIKGIDVYSTSYGIGVWCAYNRDFKKEVLQIENKLKELNIRFTNEFSDANYVYRFKISKSKENIEIIKNLK